MRKKLADKIKQLEGVDLLTRDDVEPIENDIKNKLKIKKIS